MKHNQRYAHKQKGAAMVETALVMGFLIFLLLCVVDLFFLSAAYVTYSQIAREGVLAGSAMRTLFEMTSACQGESVDIANLQHPTPEQPITPIFSNCKAGDSSTCGHYLTQWRLEKVLETFHSSFVSNGGRGDTVITRCIPGTPKAIEVELQASFTGWSPIFKNSAIRVRQWGQIR